MEKTRGIVPLSIRIRLCLGYACVFGFFSWAHRSDIKVASLCGSRGGV